MHSSELPEILENHPEQSNGHRQILFKIMFSSHSSYPQGGYSSLGLHYLKVYSPLVSSYICYAKTDAVPHGT